MGFWQQLTERAATKTLDRMAEDENYRFLRENSMFHNLSDGALLFLTKRVMERSYSRGELVCRQGNPGVCMHLIKRGSVEFSYTTNKQRIAVGEAWRDSLFGELSVLTGSERNTTVKATDNDTVLLAVSRFDFDTFRARFPKDSFVVITRMLHMIVDRLLQTVRHYNKLCDSLDGWEKTSYWEAPTVPHQSLTEAVQGGATQRQVRAFQEPHQMVSVLQQQTQCESWKPSSLQELARRLEPKTLEAGERLIGPEQCIYFVHQGKLELASETQEGWSSAGHVETNEFFGDLNVLFESCTPIHVKASEDSQLWVLSHSTFQQFEQSYPKAGYSLLNSILHTVARNLSEYTERRQEAEVAMRQRQGGAQ
ncbi:MAG: cyclic nucleotide-binding domain-containing protein [Deltaproteobacteria bacterium]|nr:MAG: cyclic nucleotide-binding domain-containing protein [Deltaproteobacteria bacterium]